MTTIQRKWLARPYEGGEWRETDQQPSEELRRYLEFKLVEENSPRHYDSRNYCDNPGRGY